MAWVRIDDQAPRHVKMLKAGPAACWLWVCGIAHCQSLLTDGFIADEALPMIGVKSGAKKLADTLVDVGLFERVEGGYRVHDYHAHNATAEEARQQRAKVSAQRAEAGRAGGVRSGIARRSNEANSKQNPSNASKQNEAPSHPILLKNPPTPLDRGVRVTRAHRKHAEQVVKLRFGCRHEPRCENHAACVDATARELAEKAS